jgi:hypothetical protein
MALATSRLSPARVISGAATVDGSLTLGHRLVRVSWFGLVLAAVAEAIGIALVATASGKKNASTLDRVTDNWLFVAGLTLLLLSIAVLALTRLWIREANEAFRYTCSLGGFDPVTPEDGELFPDLSDRLRHDVGRRLSERISRLAFVAPEVAEAQVEEGRVPHIHVCGHFLLREDTDRSTMLEVLPRARIGRIEAGESLAAPAEIKLDLGPRWVPARSLPLDPEEYERVVERVYFSLATEIYRQIRVDVARKIELLPTRHLRATAYLIEAEDYARSNTLHAYEAAGELFLQAMVLYDPRWVPVAADGLTTAGHWPVRLKTSLRSWMDERGARVFERCARRVVLVARAETGYAKMLLFRRELAGLSGQRLNPIFLVRPAAARAVARLEHVRDGAEDALHARFEAHVVLAYAWSALDWIERARVELEEARGLLPLATDEDSMYMLARATTERRLRSALPLLRRAVELDPRFEVAQYQLARQTELFWRTRASLEASVASHAIDEYRRVLRINPSNVRAWVNMGSIYWLLADENPGAADRARQAYERARRLKDTVSDIHVGDADFGLARIAAEKNEIEAAYQHYIQGMAATIAEGVAESDRATDFLELISPAMLARIRAYHRTVLAGLDESDKNSDLVRNQRLRQSVRAFVMNDLGMALAQLFQRTGEDRLAAEASDQYKAARQANPHFVLPHYHGMVLATRRLEDEHHSRRHRVRVDALEPTWAEGQLMGSLVDVVRALQLEAEADELEKRATDKQILRERFSAPIPVAPGPQLEAAGPTHLASDQAAQPYADRLERHAMEARGEAAELRDAAFDRILALFPKRRGDRWPWRGHDFDWRLIEDDRTLERDRRQCRWELEFDEVLLMALSIWLWGRASARHLSPGDGMRLAALVEHLIERFHPHPLLLDTKTLLANALRDKEMLRAVQAAERERHVEALERDPIYDVALRWLVNEDHDLAREERLALLEQAAALSELMSESLGLIAEGFWAIREYGRSLYNFRRAIDAAHDEDREAVLSSSYNLRAAVYKSGRGGTEQGATELRAVDVRRPGDGKDPWRGDAVTTIANAAVTRADPTDEARARRGQRTLSLWLAAEHRRVEANPSESDRADLGEAQLAASSLTIVGRLAIPPTWPDANEGERLVPGVAQIKLSCGLGLFPGGEEGAEAQAMLNERLPTVRTLVQRETGITLPPIYLEEDSRFEPGRYSILIDETPSEGSVVRLGEHFCIDDNEPGGGKWVTGRELEHALAAGRVCLDPYQLMTFHLKLVLEANAWRFFGVDEAGKLLKLSEDDGDRELVEHLTRKGRARTQALVLMSGVVQALVRDRVPVDFRSVIEIVGARNRHDSVGVLTERARFALRRELPRASEPGRIVDLTGDFEQAISDRVERFRGVGALSLPRDELEHLLDLMEPHMAGNGEPTTVVVRMAGLRPHVAELVKRRWPEGVVLSAEELLDQWWSAEATVGWSPSEEALVAG